jgi:acyl-coenzyme A synthetase/AMP-(fatty) acid ligase
VPEEAIFAHNLSATEAFRIFHLETSFGALPKSGQVPLGAPRVPENVRMEPTGVDSIFEVFASWDIALGYLDKEKSKAGFLADSQGKLWWKTGELVRFDNETGNYFHSGRIDNQVKVNDHNVLLDEIENLIHIHPAVNMSTVLPVEIQERNRLVAFISWNPGHQKGEQEVMAHLIESLPKYALPHKVVSVPTFPLTRSGKIDRVALLEIVATESGSADQHAWQEEYIENWWIGRSK